MEARVSMNGDSTYLLAGKVDNNFRVHERGWIECCIYYNSRIGRISITFKVFCKRGFSNHYREFVA